MTRRRITIEASEEDVEALRRAAHDAAWEARPYPEGREEASRPFEDLASRIEAALREEER